MVKQSAGGEIEVSVSDKANSDGKFSVSARQLVGGNMLAHIIIMFDLHDPNNHTRLDYNTQNPQNTWYVSGSHHQDIVRDVEITVPTKF